MSEGETWSFYLTSRIEAAGGQPVRESEPSNIIVLQWPPPDTTTTTLPGSIFPPGMQGVEFMDEVQLLFDHRNFLVSPGGGNGSGR